MILRMDRLQTELPMPKNPSPNDAAAIQELLGGKYGEMSTLMNYTFQSFNMRGRSAIRPYYDLIANIATEEYGHIELVSYAINMLLTGSTRARPGTGQRPAGGRAEQPQPVPLHRQRAGGPAGRQHGQPVERELRYRHRQPEDGPPVQLPPGVRGPGKQDPRLRDDQGPVRPGDGRLPPGARRGAHRRLREGAGEADRGERGQAAAHPDISNKKFPEARVHEEKGLHLKLYQFSPQDYAQAGAVWNGPAPGGRQGS
jgi:hypothetical protein